MEGVAPKAGGGIVFALDNCWVDMGIFLLEPLGRTLAYQW